MAKEEIVREAYGEYIEYVAQYIDENGWINRQEHSAFIRNHFYLTNNLETKFIDKVEYWRPLSLKGIDYNNGWIKIESEDDLPKEDGFYWVIDSDTLDITDRFFESINPDYFKQFSSHYQPIQKPEPPKF